MNFLTNNFKILIACMFASTGVSACTSLGLKTPAAVEALYEEAEGIDETAYATIGVYTTVIETAAVTCLEPELLSVCEQFADITARVTPSVITVTGLWGESFFYRELVSDYRASGDAVPENILAAGAKAFARASTEWAVIKPSVQNAIASAKGSGISE